MAEIRITIPENMIWDMQKKLGGDSPTKATEMVRDAFSVYCWMVDELYKGRFIVSCDENKEDVTRLNTPLLNQIRTSDK